VDGRGGEVGASLALVRGLPRVSEGGAAGGCGAAAPPAVLQAADGKPFDFILALAE
jgi:hypothetical protein